MIDTLQAALNALRDEHGFPSERAIRRCIERLRALAYVMLALQCVLASLVVVVFSSLTILVSCYTIWYAIVLTHSDDHLFLRIYVVSPFSLSLSFHAYAWLSICFLILVITLSVQEWYRSLGMRHGKEDKVFLLLGKSG